MTSRKPVKLNATSNPQSDTNDLKEANQLIQNLLQKEDLDILDFLGGFPCVRAADA